MDKHFGGVIWTNHAIQRLGERSIRQGDALATLLHPERTRYAATQGAWIYNRTFQGTDVEIVAKQTDRQEWLVLSAWSRPAGTSRNRYLVRNGFIDWLLDKIAGLFNKKKK